MTFDPSKHQTNIPLSDLFHMQISTGEMMEKSQMKSNLNCSDSLSSWMKNAKDPNQFWYHFSENNQPLDLENPEVEIEIGYLKGRNDWSDRNVFIESNVGHVTLFRGKLINGKSKGKVDPKPANHPAWRSRQGFLF